jgi:hypothetical protein
MWRHYVYIHRREDTSDVFYVGKGTVRKRKKSIDYERAYCRYRRNDWWHNVVNKHGLKIEIVASFESDIDSQSFEKDLISFYGRDNLVNLTDGGDGSAGRIDSIETKRIRSINARGKRSKKWADAIRLARKNGGNGGVVKSGDKLPEAWCSATAPDG